MAARLNQLPLPCSFNAREPLNAASIEPPSRCVTQDLSKVAAVRLESFRVASCKHPQLATDHGAESSQAAHFQLSDLASSTAPLDASARVASKWCTPFPISSVSLTFCHRPNPSSRTLPAAKLFSPDCSARALANKLPMTQLNPRPSPYLLLSIAQIDSRVVSIEYHKSHGIGASD